MTTKKLNGSYHSAIIGLDAEFANAYCVQKNINRVERALYLGKLASVQNTVDNNSKDSVTDMQRYHFERWQKAVEGMALVNNIENADISVILISQNEQCKYNTDAANIFKTISVVDSLAKAFKLLEVSIKENKLVALVGINVEEIATKATSENILSTISFDQAFNGYQGCNGVAALLFASTGFVQAHNNYVYSWLRGYAVGDNIENTAQLALKNALVDSSDVGLLEVSALSNQQSIATESRDLMTAYEGKQLNIAVSCARSMTGEGGGFSQVLGLLRSVVALQQRYIPAISDWQQPLISELAQWQASSFYMATESRPWFPHQDGNAHIAAYSCLAVNNDYCHVVLQENKLTNPDKKHPASDIRDNGFIACSDLKMVLITAETENDLLSKLVELQESSASLQDIALSYYEQTKSSIKSYTISLLAESKEELLKEIKLAAAGIKLAFDTKKDWRTPKGSYFTPLPVNVASASDENISFLYPGIGATYIGLGRDLFHLFPEIHQDVANLADDIGASLKDNLLNPRTIIRPDFKTLKQLDLNLRGSLADIAEAGVGFACVFTKVFENVFKVKADFATGYSMGEVSMYAALGAWQQPGLMSKRLANSDTFNQRLCGDLLTLREHWGLPTPKSSEEGELIWETYTIKATLDDVIAASEGEERVYCTIINTPDSLLLGGYPADCLRVIKKLGVRAMPLNMANAIHSAPAKSEYNDMVELYTMDVTARLKTKMYSSSCYLPVPQMSKAIAHSVAKCLCDQVDFPRLINTMHDKGARVFIEMGPGRSLCSWVDKILDLSDKKTSESRVTVPVNAKGTSDELTYFRAAAKLISHGVKLDLNRLFTGSIIVKNL